MRKLYKQDIIEILYGATFLGAGGGGSLCFGTEMLEKLEESGENIELDLLELSEIGDNEYAAMVAGLGSPVAMLDSKLPMFGPDAVHAFKAFQKAFGSEGKDVKYLYSGEMGGFNTFVPMLVAILSDKDVDKRIKFLDVDSNGRAVPELNTTLGVFYNHPPRPLGLGSYEGNQIAVYPISDHAGEQIARQMCMLYDMRIGFSTWGLNKAEIEEALPVGCVSTAQNIGKAILKAKKDGTDLMTELEKVMEVRKFCSGIIEKVDLKQEGGFDFGTTIIKDEEGKRYFIDFKNENLILRDESGKIYITAPEGISLVELDTMTPLTNADTKEGQRVLVTMNPADPHWWDEEHKAYTCWLPELRKVGLDGDQIRF